MATADAIRQRIRDTVYSAQSFERVSIDFTTDALADGVDTTVTVAEADNYEAGDILEFYTHGEQVLITAVNTSTNVLTIVREWNGTTAAAQASGSVIAKNPRFTRKQMDDAVTEVLASFDRMGIHAFGYGTIALVAGQYSYDIGDTDVLEPFGVLGIYYEQDVNPFALVPLPFKQAGSTNTTIVASGKKVLLFSWGELNAGESVSYTYAKRLDSVTDLLPRQEELVRLGAVAKLIGMTVAPRTQDPARYSDRTVQPGQGSRDRRDFYAEFLVSARAEAAQLAAERDQVIANAQSRRVSRYVS